MARQRQIGASRAAGVRVDGRNWLRWVLAVAAFPASACGPSFPQELLNDRAASVLELVDGTFDFEASRLLGSSSARFKPVEEYEDVPGAGLRSVEQRELGDEGFAQVESMRRAVTDAAALAAGAGLSDEVREYTAGARAFRAGEYELATAHFEAVLALPEAQRQRRGVWAQFMLGRVNLSYAGGAAGLSDTEVAAKAALAIAAFQAVRSAVGAGADDSLGLAVASYGEEAAVHWRRGDLAAAATAYAEQAAQGSASGRASLLLLARHVFADPDTLRAALQQPMLQQLLAAYVYARSNELASADDSAPDSALSRYYSAISAMDPATLAGVDRVAAAAYRAGRFELATTLASRSTTPLALWVQAKLALRRGDDAAAAQAYAAASQAFPSDENWGLRLAIDYTEEAWRPACRVDGERAILALGRGDYVQALRLLHGTRGKYWMDEARLAERVLNLDELKQFVDTAVAPAAPAVASDSSDWLAPQPDMQLRALLGRGLLRAGRYAEAAAYFPPDLRTTASAYADARVQAAGQSGIARAESLFRAATLARHSGMELLGMELSPDAAAFGGAYEWNLSAVAGTDKRFVGADEAQRFEASAAVPDLRFHYRYVAADLANQAADLVPARSQAFAAMLCSATGWLIHRDHARARTYYQRYVDHGPYLAWAAHFGRDCPAPDFSAAAKRLQFERMRWAKHLLRQSVPFVAAGMLGLGLLIVLWRRRRRTRTAG